MKKLLAVIDMQNDFVSGSLGSPDAMAICGNVAEKIRGWEGDIVCTYDTHGEDYLSTKEGRMLPVKHCIENTPGWELCPPVQEALAGREYLSLRKPTFGSEALSALLKKEKYEEIHFVGLCTDICVISNAMLAKAALPESEIIIYESCCAGVTPQSHQNALEAMKCCHMEIRK